MLKIQSPSHLYSEWLLHQGGLIESCRRDDRRSDRDRGREEFVC